MNSQNKHKCNLCDLGLDKWSLNDNECIKEAKRDKLYFIQILNFCVSKDTTKKVEDNMQIGRKFMQIIYMIRTCTENIQRILKTSKGKVK